MSTFKKILFGLIIISALPALGEDIHIIVESAEAHRINAMADEELARERAQYLGKRYFWPRTKTHLYDRHLLVVDVKLFQITFTDEKAGGSITVTPDELERAIQTGVVKPIK